jgi:hypothetical protein
MRHKAISIITIFLLSGLLIAGCERQRCGCFCVAYDAEELKLNDTIDLKYSTLYCNSKNEIRLSYDSIYDSRCPIGAMCIWEGNGAVKLHLQQSGRDPVTFWLNTHPDFLNDTVISGIRYELIDLLPYPEVGKEYQQEDYTIQLRITD